MKRYIFLLSISLIIFFAITGRDSYPQAQIKVSLTNSASTEEEHPIITAEELLDKMKKGEDVLILDVRTEGQYKSSGQHIKGDMRLELEDVDTKMKDISHERFIVTYCTCPDEATSSYFVRLLKDKGFKKAYALKGGYYAWLRVDGPTENK